MRLTSHYLALPFLALSIPFQVHAKYDQSDILYKKGPDMITCSTFDNIEMLELVNKERAKRGLNSLGFLESLNRVAAYQSWDQAIHEKMSHNDWRGRGMGARFRASGCEDWSQIRENAAVNHTSVEHVMEGWMTSPGHKANILRKGITHFGAAVWFSNAGNPYYTQAFAQMRDADPVYPIRPPSIPGNAKTCGNIRDTPRSGPPEKGGEAAQPEQGQDTGYAQPEKDTGYAQPEKDTGYAQPEKDTGYAQPEKDTGYAQPEKDTGYAQPKKSPKPKKTHPKKPSDQGGQGPADDSTPSGDYTKTYETTAGSSLAKKHCKKSSSAPDNACVIITITKTGSNTHTSCKWSWTVKS
ncbi:hypothetical protein BJ684DRAFT_21721 [Piptocephalis cylindrospora]|uniref:SCP domain-containing protein n=1 Tax=Piptocephalis cylindrospora TaxID=1907219 RepID=A0A4P9XZ07_9FUNG|nr:hypothetical protein BJ684DRAFT_21721 [Piptocephalis cylindrospora]|eukprot:RKP11698.1 hypothetical protein BJ684DRAFT_21721 [Piptocephalis cylindrospora]